MGGGNKSYCVDNLKAEIIGLKSDNNDKVNTLAKIHLMEIQELQKENII